jgi:hypothetical protein
LHWKLSFCAFRFIADFRPAGLSMRTVAFQGV